MFTINENCLKSNNCDESNEPNFYKYSGLDKLDKLDNILKSNITIKKIYICGYRVNNNELYPFLDFLLKNDFETKQLVFPFVEPIEISIDFISKITKRLNSIFYNIISDNKYIYKGLYHHKNNIYLFFDFTNCKLIINNTHKNSIIWSVLADEIINKKNVCNIKIDLDVIDFFNENIDFSLLKDENEKIYEIPTVVYIGKEISKINFTYIFGVSKPDKNLLFGPYYYFTNLKNAIKQGGWSEVKNNKQIKGGIVRFALFTGSTKVILNKISDPIDESENKMYLTSTNNLYENLTLRITDYDGKWAKKYDSIYVGDIELDNGEKMKNTPIYVVKKYEQHIPLSYHFIDKKISDDKFDPNKDYQII
jgi:hypothetical protein